MKRILAVLLLLSLLPVCSFAEEETVDVHFMGEMGAYQFLVPLNFSDDWFKEDAHGYQHALCQLSLGMALSAFRGTDAEPDKEIRSFFEELHFSVPEIQQFDVKTKDTIGTALAHRIIQTENGSFPLVAIAVCGGNYSNEWLSNFDIGTSGPHKGFTEAAEKVVDRVQQYLLDHNLSEPRFWLAGYSRGAAVSNLTAAALQETGLAPDEYIFAYTFATPRTITAREVPMHTNIFNIVNGADIVPDLPLEGWGFDRFGRTLFLPSSMCENLDYEGLLPGFRAAYEEMCGHAPREQIANGDLDFAYMAGAAATGMLLTVQNRDYYTAVYQALMGKMFSGEELSPVEVMLFTTLMMNMGNKALNPKGIVISLAQGVEAAMDAMSGMYIFFNQHLPEVYFSWLLSIPDEDLLLKNSLTLTNMPVL